MARAPVASIGLGHVAFIVDAPHAAVRVAHTVAVKLPHEPEFVRIVHTCCDRPGQWHNQAVFRVGEWVVSLSAAPFGVIDVEGLRAAMTSVAQPAVGRLP